MRHPKESGKPASPSRFGRIFALPNTVDGDEDPAVLLFMHSSTGTHILANLHVGESRTLELEGGHFHRVKLEEIGREYPGGPRGTALVETKLEVTHHPACPRCAGRVVMSLDSAMQLARAKSHLLTRPEAEKGPAW